MRIKITGFTSLQNWYSKKVGKVFNKAEQAIDGGYTLFSKKYYYHHVNASDCIVIGNIKGEKNAKTGKRNKSGRKT